jgi:peroxiredoxin family protein
MMSAKISLPDLGSAVDLEQWFAQAFERHMQEWESQRKPSLSIMVTKGTLDWAYPPFIVASTASAMDWEVTLFFTFYGLGLLKKDLSLRVSGLGNPALPMKVPYGPPWLKAIEWKIPNLAMAGIPGFEAMATAMMGRTLKDKGIAPIAELRSLCIEAGVRLIGCQMTRDLFGWKEEDFIPQVSEWAGAATYLSVMSRCRTNLYM